jgi:hypothetical protein
MYGLPAGNGVDPEMFAEFTQYAGYDDIGGVKIMQDVLPSFQRAPGVNSEAHLIGDTDYNLMSRPEHLYAAVFAQAMHGQAATAAWTFEPHSEPLSLWALSIRPAGMAAVGRCGLDLMRAAPALAAIQETPREVAVFYSPTAFYYGEKYHRSWHAAWECFHHTGLRVRFLSEKQLQAGDFGAVKVLLLPDARVVEAATLDALSDFVRAGGHIIAIGDCLEFTPPGWTPVEPQRVRPLFWKRVDTDVWSSQEQILTWVEKAGVRPLLNLRQANGEAPAPVHWLCGVLDGRKVVAAVNISEQAVRLTVTRPEVQEVSDVIGQAERTLPVDVRPYEGVVWLLPPDR